MSKGKGFFGGSDDQSAVTAAEDAALRDAQQRSAGITTTQTRSDDTAASDAEKQDENVLTKVGDDAAQYVKDAAAQLSGNVPRAAPKAGEGTLRARTAANSIPELEPAPPPAEYRAAPATSAPAEREAWGDRPTLQALRDATTVKVRTRDPRSTGVFIAGVLITPDGQELDVHSVRARSDSHLRQLATDLRIEVKSV